MTPAPGCAVAFLGAVAFHVPFDCVIPPPFRKDAADSGTDFRGGGGLGKDSDAKEDFMTMVGAFLLDSGNDVVSDSFATASDVAFDREPSFAGVPVVLAAQQLALLTSEAAGVWRWISSPW